MTNAWLQERPHLATLARSLQKVLELADELHTNVVEQAPSPWTTASLKSARRTQQRRWSEAFIT
jgi:hypothetical protein